MERAQHLPSLPAPRRPIAIAVKGYALFAVAGRLFAHLLLLAIRAIWGWQFFQTGKGKLGNLASVTEFFASLHIPAPRFNAILASCTECFGGLLLLVGLGGRVVSVPLAITMTVAYLTAERADIHSMDDFVKATPFPFLFTALVVFAFGSGALSLDGLVRRGFPRSPQSLLLNRNSKNFSMCGPARFTVG
jgi:putative oxidoreductase